MSFCLSTKKKDPKTKKPMVYTASISFMRSLTQALLNVGALDDGGTDHPPLVKHAIPAKKLSSMDGWHVTAAECAAAATALGALLKDEDDLELLFDCLDFSRDESDVFLPHLKAFAKFHTQAAKLDGYTVS